MGSITNTFEGEGYRVLAGLIDSGFEAQRGKNVFMTFVSKHSTVFSPSKGWNTPA